MQSLGWIQGAVAQIQRLGQAEACDGIVGGAHHGGDRRGAGGSLLVKGQLRDAQVVGRQRRKADVANLQLAHLGEGGYLEFVSELVGELRPEAIFQLVIAVEHTGGSIEPQLLGQLVVNEPRIRVVDIAEQPALRDFGLDVERAAFAKHVAVLPGDVGDAAFKGGEAQRETQFM